MDSTRRTDADAGPPHRLGDLQLAILDVLWARGEALASEVYRDLLPRRGLAPTTIATMLRKMEDRGLVVHRAEGRSFVYRPALARDQVHRSMVDDLVDRLFAGDAKELVNHLITEGGLGLDDLDAIRRRIARARQQRGGEG